MSERIMLKKLSPKTICGGKIEKPEKETLLFTVYGRASDVQRGESTYGPWVALIGDFEALRADDGRMVVGSKAFLPEPLHSMIANKISGAEDEAAIEFAIEVIITPAETSVGYEYHAREVVDMTESDSLAHLRQKVLPGPSKAKAETKPESKAKAEA